MISFRGTLLFLPDGGTQNGIDALKILTKSDKELKTITLKNDVPVNFSVKDTVTFSYNTKRILLN